MAPERLYLGKDEWSAALALRPVVRINPFSQPPSEAVIDLEARDGRSFAAERTAEKANVFDAVADHAATLQRSGKRVIIACWSEGSRDRMQHVLADHGLLDLPNAENWPEAQALPAASVALAVVGLESGFDAASVAIIGEQDILGDRLVRPRKKRRHPVVRHTSPWRRNASISAKMNGRRRSPCVPWCGSTRFRSRPRKPSS
ncbi:MAG: hypothetical protein ACTSP2_10485, partial [Alphaproteobacteria bacterium]